MRKVSKANRRGKQELVARAFRRQGTPVVTGLRTTSLAEPLEGRVLLATVYVDSNPAITTHDGQSWDTAYADIQPVLKATVSGDTILVADGTYKPNDLRLTGRQGVRGSDPGRAAVWVQEIARVCGRQLSPLSAYMSEFTAEFQRTGET
jgi:hypothetical protein